MFSRQRFEHLDHRLDKLELYFTIRDPGTSRSAEAYDGLRKSLIAAYKGTQIHMAQLAQLHRAAESADSLAPIIAKLGEFMQQMGVVVIADPNTVGVDPSQASFTELFDVTQAGNGPLVVDQPAYVSISDGKIDMVVSRGVAHFEEAASEPTRSGAEGGHLTGGEMIEATVVADEADPLDSKAQGEER
jgi:hypothetical protein